jgi:ATP-dependent Clp protease ATP-binding subunit ClpA
MFERFTNQSRRAVVVAQEQARDFRHGYIGTEHILLGLLCEGTGSAARVLTSMDVTLDAVRREVEATVGRGNEERSSGHIPFTPRAKKSLERSLRESLQLGSGYIGTGHLLLGLISEDDDVAVQILGTLGTDLDTLRAQVIHDIREHPEQLEADLFAMGRAEQREVGVFARGRARARSTPIPRQPREIQNLMEAIDARLSAIERHLGITRDEPTSPAAEGEAAAEAEAGGSAQAGGRAEAGGSAQAGDGPDEPPVAAG